ncbi:relaxase/mobilization nuclease domain-containing protein [Jannaschia sp. M317]|uniref:relaxase/mobilization nuclease domain-containing protein n=1 Tax=Jannaschia sp. M317 TaxID=2867011 RepID=UPI0021A8A82E|nr:relaxase/mobilization nuclease domain-containing protein [Jannaschia sp. M317]UWQ19735.1 relaxase/mobilization nuclease domain-containing protein [Jannaschia sp. M317]
MAAGLAGNVLRVPQSVVKRVAQGGCHTPAELRRQADYVLRDEARMSAWSNQIGVDRSLEAEGVEAIVADWSASWAGAPKRGHTDHLILSFPQNTDPKVAEAIARDWGQTLFASGEHRDRYRYVAALHANTEHVHAHFIVDKVGMDEGRFLSISRHSEITYDLMRELHVAVAAEHRLALNATSRLSRGIVEHAPRQADIPAAHLEGRTPFMAGMAEAERDARLEVVRGFAEDYARLAEVAGFAGPDEDGFMERLSKAARSAADALGRGEMIMAGFEAVGLAERDPAARLTAACEALEREAERTWTAIRDMESCAEKAELEHLLAAKAEAVQAVLGQNVLAGHEPLSRGTDVHSVPMIHALRTLADGQGEATRSAERALNALQDRVEVALTPHASLLERSEVTAEEVAARFAWPSRSAQAIEAGRPAGEERAAWDAMEQAARGAAVRAAAELAMTPELREPVARAALSTASASARLAEVDVVREFVRAVQGEMGEEKTEAVVAGQGGALSDHVADPGLRHVVRSELTALAAAGWDAEPEARDSATVGAARERMMVFDLAARAQEARSRTAPEHGLEL